MFEQETVYYKENLSAFQKNFLEKYIVISGDRVIGTFDSDEQAYAGAIEANCTPGAFMIKHITENPEENIQRFLNFVYV